MSWAPMAAMAAALVMQIGAVVYWAGRLSARVEGLQAAVEGLARRLDARDARELGAD